jgi:hypothetical protein
MPETFLILLGGGVLLAAAVPDPREVPPRWLQLAGTIAYAAVGSGVFFALVIRDVPRAGSAVVQRVQLGLLIATVVAVLAYAVAARVRWLRASRAVGCVACFVAVLAGSHLLHEAMVARGTSLYPGSKSTAMGLQTLACVGAAVPPGLALMNAVLARATVGESSAMPLRRLNAATGVANGLRLLASLAVVLSLHGAYPVPDLWPNYGPSIAARWALGLLLPAVLLHVAHGRLARQEVPPPVALLTVAAGLVLLGEFVALYLLRETGLPF